MNIGAIFAFLIATGICAPVDFKSPDGTKLQVIVCPRVVIEEPQTPQENNEKPPEKPKRNT